MDVKSITLEIHDATFEEVTEHVKDNYFKHKVVKIEQMASDECWTVRLILKDEYEDRDYY